MYKDDIIQVTWALIIEYRYNTPHDRCN